MDFSNKVAIITGAARGIGKAFATGLLAKGMKVCISDINEELVTTTGQSLATTYGEQNVIFAVCDVRNEDQFKNVFQVTKNKFKRVDIVINNAGVADEENWGKVVDVNLKGSILGTQLAAEALRKDRGGHGGIVVNMCSIFGVQPCSILPVYSASKYGVFGLTKSFAEMPEMKENGVKFTCLCPGAIDTEMITDDIQQMRKKFFGDTSLMSTDVMTEALFKLLNDTDNNGEGLIVNQVDPDQHMKYFNSK
ncbi:15-hydroxyprostaglandin dehydrogenase [NAD(+)]-like isoform X2 [Mizuhopecten yessoensis]|uniref:15-hydroxyprostaglandin dehydrogenase [NAD(+)] n=1 Tax=Mizuhopecten yessoensis TaxID=6573 RepID=A0A210QZ69_MIZYE|nr:15-hydroxyprostaglandin dehydrogenase [NAD(+)]-like isoform X1 [Mizuhopecten yessoensis]XP_021345981.1 15-hydroxyprostaglandin dehydrogenase [NAD(+)]-like isoform X2 [Mizuhopecten yessoensis]OWF54027.1 15-hydroxyprostaglandin dehydrogenase [NAD(+)] [Mizuhopecten yessoensis]